MRIKVGYIAAIIFVIFFVIKTIIEVSHSRCDVFNEFLSLNYNGIIVNKYIDHSNHSTRTIIIKNLNDSAEQTFDLLDWDETGVFDKLNKNDTIVKRLGSDTLYQKDKNGNAEYILTFGCKNKK